MTDGRDADAEFEALLEQLKHDRGFDFTGYKRASLRRRVAKRMAQVGIDDLAAYRDELQVHPDEFSHLFDTILINVTSWFRDPERWAYVEHEVVPQILEDRAGRPVRVWSAGCSSGEEAYTAAMLFAEAMGRDRVPDELKIYATDVDEAALTTARHARYSAAAVQQVPDHLRQRYLSPEGDGFVVRPDLRRAVIFGRHDLISDAPISRIDLLICRNVLMYVNRDTQRRILDHLHFALRDEGFVFLGRAEMLLTRTDLFTPLDLRHRVFRKVPAAAGTRPPPLSGHGLLDRAVTRQVRLRDEAFAASPCAQIVIDADGALALANTAAETLFGLGPTDLGRPFKDLQLSYRPVELRSLIEKVRKDGPPMKQPTVEWLAAPGQLHYLDTRLTPLQDRGELLGVHIAYEDVTHAVELRARLHKSDQELETAYEELQSSNEELETTNEELNSTVEELETTNEELQSSNEELETMNEELQSTNAEQEDVNHELTVRSEELNRLNSYLRSIMSSLTSGLVVVDRDMHVQLWNDRAHDLWGLQADEVVGRSLLALDVGLPVARLADPVRDVLSGADHRELELPATNRRGYAMTCRVVLTPLLDPDDTRQGAVMLLEEHHVDRSGT